MVWENFNKEDEIMTITKDDIKQRISDIYDLIDKYSSTESEKGLVQMLNAYTITSEYQNLSEGSREVIMLIQTKIAKTLKNYVKVLDRAKQFWEAVS
jgi:hypothetical protein